MGKRQALEYPDMRDLSIIIPYYNRAEVLRYCLESIVRASSGVSLEVILVDDGSTQPLAEVMGAYTVKPTDCRVVRQQNQGLLSARLAGVPLAQGRHLLFLDSDDLVSPGKLKAQVEAMDAAGADVSYTDSARCVLQGDYDALAIQRDAPVGGCSDSANFFINVQPAPHSPVFRTDYFRALVEGAYFPPSKLYNSVAEIWHYHNAAPRPAKVVYVPGHRAIVGAHAGVRLTDHWERLGVASLAVMEAFARSVNPADDPTGSRRLVGEKAFRSWRALPHGCHREFDSRLLDVWLRLAGDQGV